MNVLGDQVAGWLRSVLIGLPQEVHAVYVEYGDAYTPEMVHLACFNAFGFTALAAGHFDPSDSKHLAELGEFTWESTDDCSFGADDYPATDWMAVLEEAARSPEISKLAAERDI